MLSTKEIGNKIAEARKKKNISQAELAEQLFISSQAVGKWERGESMPDITTFGRLAQILGVDLNYFSEDGQTISTDSPTHKPEPTITEPDKEAKKRSWDMSRGNWADADFSGLKNLHEKFGESNMQRCKFIGSDLSGLLLKGNNIDACDFSNSKIANSHIQKSNLSGNHFKNCSLTETEFSGSFVLGCDLTEADLTGVTIKLGGFEKNTIVGTIWNRTSFIESYVADLVFNGKIDDCSFENCAFKKVTFQNATLTNTFFKNKNLKGIKFVDCQADKMTYEFLKNGKADLTGLALIAD